MIFQEIVYRKSMLDMILAGYLCDLRAMQLRLDTDFGSVETRAGDYAEGSLAAVMEAANASEFIARAIGEYARNRRSLVFTPGVAMAHEIAELLRTDGFKAEATDGNSASVKRESINTSFQRGDLQVVVNCGIYTEGYDNPAINCVVIARPTRSRSLFVQMLGRAMRIHLGKRDALVLDVTDNSAQHDLQTTAKLFDLPAGALKCKSLIELIAGERKAFDGPRMLREDSRWVQGRLIAQEIDLFGRKQANWIEVGPDRFTLSANGEMFIIESSDGESWRLIKRGGIARRVIAEGLSMGYAQGMAEDLAAKNGGSAFIDPQAGWRQKDVTPKQLSTLLALRIPYKIGMTRGEAADLITRAKALAS
jgi:superfamily II DNA/RNA helicase